MLIIQNHTHKQLSADFNEPSSKWCLNGSLPVFLFFCIIEVVLQFQRTHINLSALAKALVWQRHKFPSADEY